MISKEASKGLPKVKSEPVKWATKAGTFQTNQKSKIRLKLPAFHEHKEVHWQAYVEPTATDQGRYDMIIGRDLMLDIGLDLIFSEEKMVWDRAEVKMQHLQFLTNENWVDELEQEIMYIHDPITTEAERIQIFLTTNTLRQTYQRWWRK